MKRFLSIIFPLVVLCISFVNAKENWTIEHIWKDIILTYDWESITLSNETIDWSTQKCPLWYHIWTADDWSNTIKMRYNIKWKNYEHLKIENENGLYRIIEEYCIPSSCLWYNATEVCPTYDYWIDDLDNDLNLGGRLYKTDSYWAKHKIYYVDYHSLGSSLCEGLKWSIILTTNPNVEISKLHAITRCFKDDKNIVINNWYSKEYNDAYIFAYNNKITTMPTIEEANMNWEIIRAEIAKMLANWVKKFWYYADPNIPCSFTDTASVKWDLATAIIESCKYWIMWQWITQFRPYDKITKAEVATAVSRILRWSQYDWWTPFYVNHVNALENAWVLTDSYNINSNELRWNVMTILMKANNILEYNSIDCETPEYILLCTNDKEKCPEKCKK